MILEWLDASKVTQIGIELADQFAPQQGTHGRTERDRSGSENLDGEMDLIFERADREVRTLPLNFYKKAKFANSFKWRLIENGVEKSLADQVTQRLVLHLSGGASHLSEVKYDDLGPANRAQPNDAKHLALRGNTAIARGLYAEAVAAYQELIKIAPRHAVALNNLGAALSKLGRDREAEAYFFSAIKIEPNFSDAHSNVGNALLLKGQYADAEQFLRHALKLNPRLVEARVNLGLALSFVGRLRDAKSNFDKALKHEPRNADALCGLGFIAMTEGNFELATVMLDRALVARPKMPRALALQVGLRKMALSDSNWVKKAEEVAAGPIAPMDESEMRFSIGKYYDDVGDYKLAFENYKRANDLLKPIREPYDPEVYKAFVDDMIRVYTPGSFAELKRGGSNSARPVLVIGMPRSGTSLTEQIISTHRLAKGAGELNFWSNAFQEHEAAIRENTLDESARKKLAEQYLQVLSTKSADAARVVDKAPVNSDYLGVFHSIFPNARIIYMQRNPIDTCLSCYFQKFVLSLNFTMDLTDLAAHYRQHQRLMNHWRTVLPPGSILDVPYEQLVADQESWSRRILDFIGLDWDDRVMDFYATERAVVTASYWQVRQKMYTHSVERWRKYRKFIGPLLDLK
jgi:tetratricopeptide (TPR) repeat protein